MPGVDMRVDETRRNQHAARVDLGVDPAFEFRADVADLVALVDDLVARIERVTPAAVTDDHPPLILVSIKRTYIA